MRTGLSLLALAASAHGCAFPQRSEPRQQEHVVRSPVASSLDTATSKTSTADILRTLAELRRHSPDLATAECVARILRERHPAHRDRDMLQVSRIRVDAFLTLAALGVPANAVPQIVDALANTDEFMDADEVAAAARCVRRLGRDGRPFLPYLQAAARRNYRDAHVTLGSESTTVDRELGAAIREVRR